MSFAFKPARPKRRDGNAEARIQAAIVEWARTCAPDVLVFAIPNGGLRSKSEAARLKWTGVLAGVPDLCVIGYGGIAYFLEVKPPGAALTGDQPKIFDRLRALGAERRIVRSIDDARDAFADWGIATRECR